MSPPRSRAVAAPALLGLLLLLACAALARAEVVQSGHIRVKVDGDIAPRTLPRSGTAPIGVEVGGQIETTDGSPVPALQTMEIELNREGRIDTEGLPLCPYQALEPASSARALASCRAALVGRGDFEADISLPGQPSYQAKGPLLAFNGEVKGKPVLFAHIYAPHPFATSFVIVFKLGRASGGTYASTLIADLPAALGSWGRLTGIELHLERRYSAGGATHSYLSAGCPAPKGFGTATFALARTSFRFVGGPTVSGTLSRTCRTRG